MKRVPARARPDEPYRLGDVMARAGYADEDSFRAWRVRAEAQGFPPPLPGCTRPLKWSREQVDAWFVAGGRPAQIALAAHKRDAGEDDAPLDELAAARARLRFRAGVR